MRCGALQGAARLDSWAAGPRTIGAMSDGISRRDFLNGVAVALGASWSAGCGRCGHADEPRKGGRSALRGSSDDAFGAAHALRDGQVYDLRSLPIEDEVALVIVGAGLSGLAAAHAYRRHDREGRVLLLDNHDEFGGHARRCEMEVDGRLILGYGGSESIQSPRSLWSEGALGLLRELGVDLARFERYFDQELYAKFGLSRGVLFTREAFGVDRLVSGDPTRMVADDVAPERLNARSAAAFVADFPLNEEARAGLRSLYDDPRDVLHELPADEKRRQLASMSYREFLIQRWGLAAKTADVFQKRSHDLFAIGVDAVPALDAMQVGYPGFQGLGLADYVPAGRALDEPYIYHFPDGNASIARLLVRRLIPGVAAGTTMEDVVTARFDPTQLDRPGARTRLRLNSTVVALRSLRGGELELGYVREGALSRLRAKRLIHAGYNMMLPFMTSELEAAQRDALRACVKAPLVYVKVALRNWQAWVRAGVHEVTNPMGFFSRIKLDYPVSMGGYAFARSPREPIGVHLVHVPTPRVEGGDARSAFRLGRAALLALRFEDFEARVFDELTRFLGPHGFVARRDIAAIHVYRWGHGYAYGFNSLYDPPSARELPALARRRVGQLGIANSDAAWTAFAPAAIDQGTRAVEELMASG